MAHSVVPALHVSAFLVSVWLCAILQIVQTSPVLFGQCDVHVSGGVSGDCAYFLFSY